MRKVIAFGFVVAALAGPATTTPALAEIDPDLTSAGWHMVSVPGQTPARFLAGGPGEIKVLTDRSVAFLYRPVTEAEASGVLNWRWRVDKAGPDTDQAEKGKDDRPIAVHLWFPMTDEQWSFTDWLYDLFGFPAVGNALTYVWGGRSAVGTSMANPHLPPGRGVITIASAGPEAQGRWIAQSHDYAADFERYFGRPAPKPVYIAISGDTDDVGGMSAARIADLRFSDDASDAP